MSRYFSEQTLLDLRDKDMNYVYDLTDLAEYLAGVPTADVVPKRDYNILKSLITHKEEEAYNKGYADVVRDIFEEIDSKIIAEIDLSNAVLIEFEGAEEIYNRIKGEVSALCKLRDFIAELKKKYTEGGGLNEL